MRLPTLIQAGKLWPGLGYLSFSWYYLRYPLLLCEIQSIFRYFLLFGTLREPELDPLPIRNSDEITDRFFINQKLPKWGVNQFFDIS
jgi:hypothetical protein